MFNCKKDASNSSYSGESGSSSGEEDDVSESNSERLYDKKGSQPVSHALAPIDPSMFKKDPRLHGSYLEEIAQKAHQSRSESPEF